jgi:hypothetical protein
MLKFPASSEQFATCGINIQGVQGDVVPEAFTEAKKDLCSSAEVHASGAAPPAICHPERSEGSLADRRVDPSLRSG